MKPRKEKGLACPACHGKTVERNVAEDGYFVEVCIGGQVQVQRKKYDGTYISVVASCEYWKTGWVKKELEPEKYPKTVDLDKIIEEVRQKCICGIVPKAEPFVCRVCSTVKDRIAQEA